MKMGDWVLSTKVSIRDSLALFMCEVALFQVDICDFIVVSGTMDPKGKGKMASVEPEVNVVEAEISDD